MKSTGSTIKNWTLRNWITVGLLGALWGAVEMTLGSVLHMIFPPLANTFLTGVLLSGIGTILALTGKVLVPRKGTVFYISILAALIKLLSFGGVKIGPVLAILIQGLLMEACFLPKNRMRSVQFIGAGMLSVSWNFFHRFIMLRLLYGRSILQTAVVTAESGGDFFNTKEEHILAVLLLLFFVRIAVGAAAGAAGRSVGFSLKERLKRYEERG